MIPSKWQLFATNLTAQELLTKKGVQEPSDEPSNKSINETADDPADEPSVSIGTFSGIVFDLANRMIHISNEPTDAAIEAAARLLPKAFSGSKKELAPLQH